MTMLNRLFIYEYVALNVNRHRQSFTNFAKRIFFSFNRLDPSFEFPKNWILMFLAKKMIHRL